MFYSWFVVLHGYCTRYGSQGEMFFYKTCWFIYLLCNTAAACFISAIDSKNNTLYAMVYFWATIGPAVALLLCADRSWRMKGAHHVSNMISHNRRKGKKLEFLNQSLHEMQLDAIDAVKDGNEMNT